MNAHDRKSFLEIVIGFAELKGKSLSAPALELYWNAMQGWALEDFQEAANELLRKAQFMPTPKDFEDLRKAGRDTAGEAWLEAQSYVRWGLHGHTLDPACPRLIAQCVRMIGGANVIAMCDEDKLPFLERRFTDHFEALQEVDDVRASVPQIAFDNPVPERPTVSGTFKAIGRESHALSPFPSNPMPELQP